MIHWDVFSAAARVRVVRVHFEGAAFLVADPAIVAAVTIMRVLMHRTLDDSKMDARAVSKNDSDFLKFSQGAN